MTLEIGADPPISLYSTSTVAASPRLSVVSRAGPDAPSGDWEDRPRQRRGEEKMEFKHFLPLPKPKHLVYIKPTVAVVGVLRRRRDCAPRRGWPASVKQASFPRRMQLLLPATDGRRRRI